MKSRLFTHHLPRLCMLTLALVAVGCATADGPAGSDSGQGGDSAGVAGSGASSSTGGSPAAGGSGTGAVSGTGGAAPITCDGKDEKSCGGECLIPNTDLHCGACNRRCSAGTVCNDSGAGTYDCGCPGDQIRCGGACTDPETSNLFCGASGTCSGPEAGNNCGSTGTCVKGGCECDSSHTECGGGCVDTTSDPAYCGTAPDECGVACKTNEVCSTGNCVCPTGKPTSCAAGCFDTQNDAEACGGCVGSGGQACDTEKGFICSGGSCACPTGWTLCGGKCVDTQTDPDNCAGCSNGGTISQYVCGFSDAPANTQRLSCGGGKCVTGPCDPIIAPECSGLTIRDEDDCYSTDDHFSGGGIKCDNNSGPQVPKGTALCYEVWGDPKFEKFRCWWSARSRLVNNSTISCNSGGNNYVDLPAPEGGGYCVKFPASDEDGAQTDGFSMGKF